MEQRPAEEPHPDEPGGNGETPTEADIEEASQTEEEPLPGNAPAPQESGRPVPGDAPAPAKDSKAT